MPVLKTLHIPRAYASLVYLPEIYRRCSSGTRDLGVLLKTILDIQARVLQATLSHQYPYDLFFEEMRARPNMKSELRFGCLVVRKS
jgi:hypothetical protein